MRSLKSSSQNNIGTNDAPLTEEIDDLEVTSPVQIIGCTLEGSSYTGLKASLYVNNDVQLLAYSFGCSCYFASDVGSVKALGSLAHKFQQSPDTLDQQNLTIRSYPLPYIYNPLIILIFIIDFY